MSIHFERGWGKGSLGRREAARCAALPCHREGVRVALQSQRLRQLTHAFSFQSGARTSQPATGGRPGVPACESSGTDEGL
jgi:hypothetical protein